MTIPSSAVQWILDSPQQMTIYRPRDYSSLFLWFGMAAAVVIAFALLALLVRGARGAVWIAPVVLLFGLFFGYLTYSDAATAVASKTDGTLRITNERGVTDTYPLQSVQKAVVETQDGNSRRMVFVLSTGEDVPLGMWAPRDGLNQAADAFNRFLTGPSDASGQPASTSPQSEEPDWLKTMKQKEEEQKADYERRKRTQPTTTK